ncbi:MAG TPA: glycine cleavage system protein GcvH [Anaerolineales bacterium]|nr:glycine cleavage system protein GcvH [Anaerolineales bacterium]
MMEFPKDLKYTKNDEWIRVEGQQATAGITDYAQDQLSDIVFVEVVAGVGETVAQGAACATVESVKAAAEVYMPAGGKITAVNEALPNTPELVNKEPYGGAWMVRFELTHPKEVDGLMDAAAYEAYCQERSH